MESKHKINNFYNFIISRQFLFSRQLLKLNKRFQNQKYRIIKLFNLKIDIEIVININHKIKVVPDTNLPNYFYINFKLIFNHEDKL